MRKRDIGGIILALAVAVILMVREFLSWESWLSLVKLSLILLGAFMTMVGLRIGSRPIGMAGLSVTVLATPFVFRISDFTSALEVLIFVFFVAVPIVLLLELVTALKAGKGDVSLLRILLNREMELKRYHFLPITVCLGIVVVVMVVMSIILSTQIATRMLTSRGFLIWEILIFTGLALIFTVPLIGPFSVKLKN